MSKITAYAALAAPLADDVLPVVDVHDTSMAATGTTKKIAVGNLVPAATGIAPGAVQLAGDLGGTATAPVVVPKTDLLNVKTAYGAKGDGTTDDTAAINSAITALNAGTGGGLFFPYGEYRVSPPALTAVTRNCVTIAGDGWGESNNTAGSCLTALGGTWTTPMITLSGEGIQMVGMMVDGQGSAHELVRVAGGNCKIVLCGTHGVASGGTCINVVSGGYSVWIDKCRPNGINGANTGIAVADTDAIITNSKPENGAYGIQLLAGSDGALIIGNHFTPGSAVGKNGIFISASTSHIGIIGNRFDNHPNAGIQITPGASSPNTVTISGNVFHSIVQTDNTWPHIAVDTTQSSVRGLVITGNVGYGQALNRPAYGLAAMTAAGAAATNPGRVSSQGCICSDNSFWAATSFYGPSVSPTVGEGNMITADGTTFSAVQDVGDSGGVTSVTAADTSIVVGGTTSAPTVATGTLDVIAADHPAAADWSNNSHKITSVANGTAAQDAAAWGQTVSGIGTTLGDIFYVNSTPAAARLGGNSSATKNFLTQTGTGSVSAAPAWGTIAAADLPTGTTSAKGALQLDGTAADITPDGNQAAGAAGKAADSGHVHPAIGQWMPTDAGYLEWVYDPALIQSGQAAASGTIYLARVNIRDTSISATNVTLYLQTAGTTLTASECFAGVYNSSGTLVAATADQSANWATGGAAVHTMALAGGPFTLSQGFVWVAILANWTGTAPQFGRALNNQANQANAGFTAATARWATNGTGTTLPATITPASNALNAIEWWAAFS